MDPWSKVTASRASDGVIDRPMTSAERMKLHRRRLGLRPVQVIVSQLDIDCARGAPTRFQQNLHVEGPSPCNLIEFLKNGDGCGFNPTVSNAFSAERKLIRGTLVEMINTQISHLT